MFTKTRLPGQQLLAPHRLIDIRDPADSYSAAEFRQNALQEMQDIVANGKIPLLVGGTMFYFHALEYGLSELPSADNDIRMQLGNEAERIGWPAMHARLQREDPLTAERINPNDTQRIQRALEIIEISGQKPSVLRQRSKPTRLPYKFIKIAIQPADRAQLHATIEQRFESMLKQGLVAEVEALYHRGDLSIQNPSVRTVGYRQVWEYLTATINYYEMVDRGIAATRQLAKRQLTWLRSYKGVKRFESGKTGDLGKTISDFIKRQSLL